MTNDYWPWWVGGPLLAAVVLLYPFLTGSPLGVSGALGRLLGRPGETGAKSSAPGTACAEPAELGGCEAPRLGGATTDSESGVRGSSLVFLLAIALGGALAGWVGGKGWGSLEYSPEFHRLLGSGLRGWLILFVGGVLVGFGTRWAGGCTSGHGLSGCGRLQPASLVATAVFFGVAILVSFVLEAVQ